MTPRWRLFTKYLALIVALVSLALLASGGISLYFSHQENQAHLVALQQEKATAAALRIEQYIRDLEEQLGWTALPQVAAGGNVVEQRRFEYLKLLRQVPPITEVSWIDNAGREQLKVSRLAMDVVGSDTDYSKEPRFTQAKGGRTYFSPVYFRKETEPYLTISRPAGGRGGGVTVAEVNLKFVWEVVSQIKIGKAGLAYVVNADGILIAHPDISLVLQRTDLNRLPHVSALKGADKDAATDIEGRIGRDLKGREVLTAHASIPTLDWEVLVEMPLAEALEPIYVSLARTALLLLLGLVLSVVASVFLARRMVQPIRVLQEGAAQIGAGKLDQRIEVRTGDELEALGEQFNKMAAELKASYAGLERKVEERTAELREALEQQTATAEILRVISSSPSDVQPVFNTIVRNAVVLCDSLFANVFRFDGDMVHFVATSRSEPEFLEILRNMYPMRPNVSTISGRVILTKSLVHVEDVLADPHYDNRFAAAGGWRRLLGVPMLREGIPVGAIVVGWDTPGSIPSRHEELLKTFADQAVIAIENVRLFNETKEALEQQTATAGILRVISGSTTNVHPVFDAILAHALRLCDASFGYVCTSDGDAFDIAVQQGLEGKVLAAAMTAFHETRIPGPNTALGRLRAHKQPVHIRDARDEEAYRTRDPRRIAMTELAGARTMLAVPLLKEGVVIGATVIYRREVKPFTDKQIALVQTFADQAMIAIENVRLFNEIQEKSRQLEIANKHKSEFLANMSHELRTPLNAIIGFSEALIEKMFGEMTSKQEEYLKDIHSSGRHLLSLINDILDLSKVEAGRMELEVSEFHLPSALANAMTLVRERAQNHGIALKLQVDPKLGEMRADERKFKQIMLNLLSNAVKFTPDGGRVEVDARMNGDAIDVSVKDTGVGIVPEDHAAVFEEFRQVGRNYTNKQEGTGLGLALTRRFVELHGGKIWLESAPGKGSTFTFTLPLK